MKFLNRRKLSDKTEMNNIQWLEKFYSRLCDGDWEHQFGFKIDNLDNPGWDLKFDLDDTKLIKLEFEKIYDLRTDNDWIICELRENQFWASGGPFNLDEMLTIFRNWVEANLDEDECPWQPELAEDDEP